ncbi:sensor histidine kinase [Dyadobacter subterraneus]|uniref:Histidine kinase n=1 Tax=Dyadobacter subterraneus TaxID=2773304 RepID=A0ABR9WG95_9BACT|nr:histidine kinase [Dyadobacter subterraneus]MBE9464455.1 histidine kinase [Dyadobacter subterraneus]
MRRSVFDKKWLLGFALAIIYIPLRTFINVQHDIWYTILSKLPLFLIEILVSTIFFTSWIYMIDWGLKKLAKITGSDKSSEFQLSNQLITLVPAVLLAILFNWMLIFTWGFMETFWDHIPMTFSYNPKHAAAFSNRYKGNQALTILALISAYYLCVSNQVQENFKKVLVDSQILEKENINARFMALKNQISPHFLFNNLSVLASLVESHPEKSGEFIHQLSLAYRYILQQSELRQISLKDEMNFLETYTFLLRTRFKEKVVIEANLSAHDLETYSLIPLTLQLLIENAIKHNTMSLANPLHVRIFIEEEMLVVCNPLQKRNLTEPTTQLGLKNIINRYNLLLNRQVIVEKTAEDFVVKIPLIA